VWVTQGLRELGGLTESGGRLDFARRTDAVDIQLTAGRIRDVELCLDGAVGRDLASATPLRQATATTMLRIDFISPLYDLHADVVSETNLGSCSRRPRTKTDDARRAKRCNLFVAPALPLPLPRDADVVPGLARPSSAPPDFPGEQISPQACEAAGRSPSSSVCCFLTCPTVETNIERSLMGVIFNHKLRLRRSSRPLLWILQPPSTCVFVLKALGQ